MEAHAEAANWWTVAQVVGAVLGAIGIGFMAVYQRWAKQHEGAGEGDIAQRAVGAAFVDRGVAKDIARIADNTDKIRALLEDVEERRAEVALIKKVAEAMEKKKRDEEAHASLQKRLPGVD